MDNKMKQRLNQRSAQLMGPRIERRVEQLMTRADIMNQQFGQGGSSRTRRYWDSFIWTDGKKNEKIEIPPTIIEPSQKFKIYGIADVKVKESEQRFLSGSVINYYITEQLDLLEFCELLILEGLSSKKINITASDGEDYIWDKESNIITVNHNLNGIVDYVLRLNDKDRIITVDSIENENTLLIKIPDQLELTDSDFLSLIIYKISKNDNENFSNIFKSRKLNLNNNVFEFTNPFDSNIIDIVIRDTENCRLIFETEFTAENKLKIIVPNDFDKTTLGSIYIYTNIKAKTLNIQELTDSFSDTVEWKELENYFMLKITHNLDAIPNIIIRDIKDNYSLIKYYDFNIDNNNIAILIPKNEENGFTLTEIKEKQLMVDVYPIFKPEVYSINVE